MNVTPDTLTASLLASGIDPLGRRNEETLMSESQFDTVLMTSLLQRWQNGDRSAADTLFLAVERRLEHLAHRMLRNFPRVRIGADSNDVLQNALIRLFQTLKSVAPSSTREFYNLAAMHIRRELIDMTRRFRGPKHSTVRHSHEVRGHRNDQDSGSDFLERAPSPEEGPDEMELWRRFHEAVEELPADEREVVSLTFYHGWTRPEIARLLQVSDKTVRRKWSSACARLVNALGGQLPTLSP
jgi:RNA polymerase sigma-70 factor (ECF subfamily)